MTTAGKIRVLLLLLFVSLLFTAIIVEKTYSPANNLAQTARVLEDNLHKRESLVYSAINDKQSFDAIKNLTFKSPDALNYISKYTTDNRVWLLLYKNDRLYFWTGIKALPNPNTVKEGCSFVRFSNAYFEVIKKTQGDLKVLFLIPVKNNYAFENKYLENSFYEGISDDRNIDIAQIADKDVQAIHDINNTYLFSLKLIKGKVNNHFFYFEIFIWLLTVLTLCILIHNIVTYLANKKNWVYVSLLTLAAFIIAFRFINLHYGWPAFTQQLPLFDPIFYASSYVYPSLGDFCINILAISWFVSFIYTQRTKLINRVPGKAVSYLIFMAGLAILFFSSTTLLNLFYGLVINSKINFDVNNVLNLTSFSMVGVLMLCFSFMIFFLMSEVVLTSYSKLDIPAHLQAMLLIGVILLVTAVMAWFDTFTLFYLFWGALVLMRGYAYVFNEQKFTASSFLFIVLICAVIAAIKLNYFESVKEKETRKVLIQRLEIPDDITADILFKKIERQIIRDPYITKYFITNDHDNDYLKGRLQKLYFDRYLSKYDFKVHEFDPANRPISSDKSYSLENFKDLVVYSSLKVSDYFYRENDSFGVQSYFAILPVIDNGKNLGTIVIELRSKPFLAAGTFPELLIDKNIKSEAEFKDYSYAFYSDNNLIGQSGSYIYSVVNRDFKGHLKEYTVQANRGVDSTGFDKFTTYTHLLYEPSARNLIVVSKPENRFLSVLTALTFFFVVLLAFSAIIVGVRLLWIRVKIFNINNDRIRWSFKINFDRILYKTRIQFSMIFAVVITLILVGIITFISISTQYQSQQDKLIRTKIIQLSSALEIGPLKDFVSGVTEENRVAFDLLSTTYSTDMTLFDLNGVPLVSTQPKIYEDGLLDRRMNARAFVALSARHQSEVVNEERIGKLNYKAAYAPLRNVKHETIAYLQLPYFSNETDQIERVGSLLNIMINVYALVFIAIGLFAVIIARQITAPLNFIQYNLSRTIYGKKNEPIKWERDDEIGALVKEYNNMIAALEQSAVKLAQSERESAWREMAKQVAHEIKNPLTPLKLGLQLLDKSWKDKDPKFDAKFERFSKSFVEQIESLSSIASEFSAFAKMPDTRIERIDIFEMLNQAVTIFKHMDNVTIQFAVPETPFYISADRDQLLRCFNNLLKNAIEATPQDTQCVIEINSLITSKNILLTIKDNGNGIPENMREKIFEPNFTTKSSGTGLGLAFVKNSIENASGKVWFETTIGIGTTFYLSFPAAELTV
ncbi:ATP-binding protein [Mucilaginibacter glaciei]|uniref:histidine kinase n=1 Tax=Mucilaginibacter glaciei TaxID=2772109 RepID=A0A926NXM4_9SPHI|nr:ATP-binding protein [Mucilaginibacter glaciei]MBD1393703.1 GHKL domain-containing protein [Mucilaginibacter glaciei]